MPEPVNLPPTLPFDPTLGPASGLARSQTQSSSTSQPNSPIAGPLSSFANTLARTIFGPAYRGPDPTATPASTDQPAASTPPAPPKPAPILPQVDPAAIVASMGPAFGLKIGGAPAPTQPQPTAAPLTVQSTPPVIQTSAAPIQGAPPVQPMALESFPHPPGDDGRGLHWIPTTSSPPDVVDKYVAEAQKMGVKWVTFLNDGASVGPNDYLVKKLTQAGIEPVMRIFTSTLGPVDGDLEGMVRHYVGLGVHYFQPYNEPNLGTEQPDGQVSVDRYLDNWIPAAQAITRGGGLPGFGSLAPAANTDDKAFLSTALDHLKARGGTGLLNNAWLSIHNYAHNYSVDPTADDRNGFFRYRTYEDIVQQALGRPMPVIGTEGGTYAGERQDASAPAVSQQSAVDSLRSVYQFMQNHREPWNFAYSYWTIANEAGGGSDRRYSNQALFKADGSASPIVSMLQSLGTTPSRNAQPQPNPNTA